jgi:predicted glutamine amidotransferase
MSIFWGLTINKDSKIECAVKPYAEELNLRTGNAGAWGLGYYSAGELLQRIEPREQGEPLDVARTISGIQADLILMHTRSATVGPLRRENIHPFRFKEWMFAHNGTVQGFEAIQAKMQASMPPFLLRSIRGETDSENLFYVFLSFLYDAGLLGRSDLGIGPIRDALQRTISMIDEVGKEKDMPISNGSFIVSDGYSLVVLSRGVPVDYVLIEGIRDCSICRHSVRPGHLSSSRVNHEDLRAVIVRSGNIEAGNSDFQRLPPNTFLMITKTHGIEFSAFV